MKTIEELRVEFEKQSNIKRWVRFIKYSPALGEYKNGDKDIPEYTLGFINGSWFMFQELKK